MQASHPHSHVRAPSVLRPHTHDPLCSWQQEHLYDHAQRYFDELIASILQAQNSVVVEFYIFDCDSLGLKIIGALRRVRERGVAVRVLIDGVGTAESGEQTIAAMQAAGIAVKIFHPLPWQIARHGWSLREGSRLGRLWYLIRNINRRDHRKLCIVDNQVLWTGSLNVSLKHLPVAQGGENWRDYGVRLSGPGVAEVAENFNALWTHQRPRLRRGFFQYHWNNLTALARRRKNRLLVQQLSGATQRIWITSAYFCPSARVLKALKTAAAKGVDTRLLIPQTSDVYWFPLLTASYYSDLLKAGVRVFEYGPRFLHAKALLIDSFCLIGSTNFNHRSYLHDLELDIVLHAAESKRQLEAYYLHDMAEATEVKLESIGFRKRLVWLGWVPRLLRYWM